MKQIDRAILNRHKAIFAVSFALILIALVWAAISTKYFRHPGTHWIVLIALSALLVAFTYIFCKHNENVAANTGKEISFGFMLVGWFTYGIIAFAANSTARSQAVDNCISNDHLATSSGYIPDAKKYIDFYSSCPNSPILLDAPAKDYVTKNQKLPSWIMTPDGYTSDVMGWLQYYKASPLNPYDLNSLTDQELAEFYEVRHLPERFLKK